MLKPSVHLTPLFSLTISASSSVNLAVNFTILFLFSLPVRVFLLTHGLLLTGGVGAKP